MKHLLGLLFSTGFALLIFGIIWAFYGSIRGWTYVIGFAVFLCVEAIIGIGIHIDHS